MKTRQVTERIGENLGPIDWTFDFKSFDATTQDHRIESAAELRKMEVAFNEKESGDVIMAHMSVTQTSSEVLAIGMYDGWPFWRPIPSFAVLSPLGGGEWHPFYYLSTFRKMKAKS